MIQREKREGRKINLAHLIEAISFSSESAPGGRRRTEKGRPDAQARRTTPPPRASRSARRGLAGGARTLAGLADPDLLNLRRRRSRFSRQRV
eukprot:SAG11_NODE_2624_length_3163_cov_3.247228_3_plen_92_part_00